MRKGLSIFLRGILFGFVSTSIPGISSATIAVLVGIYQLMINSISDVFTNFKKSFKILFFLILGFLLGAILGTIIFVLFFQVYPVVLVLLVIGILLGGLPQMLKNLKPGLKYPSCWVTLIITILISNICVFVLPIGTSIDFMNMISMDYILLFLTGILTSITIAIPGVDYAILLLALGYYHPLIQTVMGLIFFQNVLHNLGILIIYGVGYLVGLLIFSKLMKFLTTHYQKQTAFAGFAYVLIAPFLLVKTCVNNNQSFDFNYWQVGLGLMLGFVGFIFIFFLPKILKHVEAEDETKLLADSISSSNEMYSRRIMKMPPRVSKVIFNNIHVAISMVLNFKRFGNPKKYSMQKRSEVFVKYIDIFHKLAKVDIVSSGLDKLPKDLGACCFMGNHQGMDDPLVISTVLRDYPASFLANSERGSNFVVDAVYNLVEAERIDVFNIRKQYQTYANVSEGIIKGRRYIIFPEAWYSDNKNTLLEFHSPCFVPVLKTKCPIIPFCLYDSWKVFEDQGNERLKVECHILDPIYYEEYQNLNKKELANLVKMRIQAKLDELNAR